MIRQFLAGLAGVSVLFVSGLLWARPADLSGVATMTNYLDLLESGNFESAEELWYGPSLERSRRFGIRFLDAPVRPDATSPAVYNLQNLKKFFYQPARQSITLPGDHVRMEFGVLLGSSDITHNYYARMSGDYFWFVYPQDYYCMDWPVRETKYFRVHVKPEAASLLHPVLIDQADRTVERLSDSLNLISAARKALAEQKIEFFLCDTEKAVGDITGDTVKGMLDQASNDIISAEFPHPYELVHLLTNIRLQQTYTYTLPLIREGLAVSYGGRWGKRASALLDLGAFLVKDSIIDLDSLLTVDDFNGSSGSDIAYPVAGAFVEFLLDRLGQDRFFELYRGLSGPVSHLDTVNHVWVQTTLTDGLQASGWQEVRRQFFDYLTNDLPKRSACLPGPSPAAKTKTVVSLEGLKVLEDQDWMTFEFRVDSAKPAASFLFGYDARLIGVRSDLYATQFDTAALLDGHRFAVRVDANEAGLYDFATNELVAKYIFGMTPSPDYLSSDRQIITVRFRKALFDAVKPDSKHSRLLPL